MRDFLYTNIPREKREAEIERLNKELEQNPENVEALLYRAELYLWQKSYDQAIDDIEQVLALQPETADAFALRAQIENKQGDNDASMKSLLRALDLDPQNALAFLVRGNIHIDNSEYINALADFNRAIELDPQYAGAHNNRGIIYAILKQYDSAIADYTRAIELDPQFAFAYNNRGSTYDDLEQYEQALEDYTRAIELDPQYANAYYNRGYAQSELHLYEQAANDYEAAAAIYEQDSEVSLASMARDQAALMRKRAAPLPSVPRNQNGITSKEMKAINAFMQSDEIRKIERQMATNTQSFNRFIEESPSPFVRKPPQFHVLRRWNSYTPIIAKSHVSSRGGGYFIDTGTEGIVIDPGFNFIENFQEAGYRFQQITKIFITHAHNDHTSDLESILTLLYKYNELIKGDEDSVDEKTIYYECRKKNEADIDKEELKKQVEEMFSASSRRKTIEIYVTQSTYKKYIPQFILQKSAPYRVKVISENDPPIELGDDFSIQPICAKHNDILSDQHSVGFLIRMPNYTMLYTGDTGFSKDIEKKYTELSKTLRAEANADGKKKPLALLAHIGGFKKYEDNYKDYFGENNEDRYKPFYKNHLGRLGLFRVAQILKPQICIISEFGEEFMDSREALCDEFGKHLQDTAFFPADIGFKLNEHMRIEAITEIRGDRPHFKPYSEYIEYKKVKTLMIHIDCSLRYYKDDLNPSYLTGILSKIISAQYD